MATILIGNAPCSWGTVEFEGFGENQITAPQMLDELAETGYTATELGDWGFLPTAPALVGLVFDTGHYAFGAGGCETMLDAFDRFADRIWYVHFKDCDPMVLMKSQAASWDYFTSLRNGIFCELGQGCVDFGAVKAWLERHNYDGCVTVEQDLLPGMGTPKQSALRNRQYLRSIGL